jgi:two-component system, LytTR family, response regulator
MVGRTVSHYQVVEKIGAGGMGLVYKAVDTRLKRTVALKFLPTESRGSASQRARFLEEAQAAAALDHPNICTVYDVGETDGQIFIAMAFIEGASLQERLLHSPPGAASAFRIAAEIAHGLWAAHQHGIVHRDIKPGNVLLTASGGVKIVDFGLAQLPGKQDAGRHSTAGTPTYMSPEQVTGAETDPRTDVWSLGVVLYQMLTGELPFPGEYRQAVTYAILNESPIPPSQRRPSLPPDADVIIAKALAKDPEQRYQYIDEMLQDLRATAEALEYREPGASAPSSSAGLAAQGGSAASGSAIRALIVDDEPLARMVLRELLQAHPEVEIVAECGNGFEAVKEFAEHKPDLLFLDVQMPKLDGFEVLELIGREVAVVFTTAYDQYAMRAFEVHAVDYLLKPFNAARLGQALDQVKQRLGRRAPEPVRLAAEARPPAARFAERIVIRDGAKVHILPVDKLDYVEAQDDYVSLRSENRSLLKQQTIASLEQCLDPSRFVRVHRSYILNVERIVQIEPYAKDSKVAILQDGARLPVSRSGYARLRALLGE